MEFRFIDKSFYNELTPQIYRIQSMHSLSRPDLFPEIETMSKKQFKERIKIKGFIGIAAYIDNSLCGYCFCRIKKFSSKINPESKSLWIDEFFICDEFRKSGYGKQLFEKVKEVAKENLCSSIEFEVWDFNENAQKFYDSLGCKTQKITKEYIL